jgi:chorismate synthase
MGRPRGRKAEAGAQTTAGELSGGICRLPGRSAPPTFLLPMPNSFGKLFQITTWGESHGPAVGVVVDGCPPRLPLAAEEIQAELDRRRPGQSDIVTPRKEEDRVEILSGVFEGRTTGTPISMLVRNADQRSNAYDEMKDKFRPSHADFTYQTKFGIRDHRGGGRSSARETIGRVAAGAIAKKILAMGCAKGASVGGVEIRAFLTDVHDISVPAGALNAFPTLAEVEATAVRCPHRATAEKMIERIKAVRSEGDSVGGVIECRVRGVPAGLGEPVFDRLEADLAKAMLSLPATKGFEIGSGFGGARMRGSEHNDLFETRDGRVRTVTNRSGGTQGGISNGEEIVFRVAFKPTATILQRQQTVDLGGAATELIGRGRHDPCVVPRAVPIVEAMTALVLLDHWMRHAAQNQTFQF